MKIHEASELSGLSAKTIRYYESVGLVPEPQRAKNGYRDYAEQDVHFLEFVHLARVLGFTVEDCELLISLYLDRDQSPDAVIASAERKIFEIEEKLCQLTCLSSALEELIVRCQHDDRPKFPLLKRYSEEDVL
jgi:MerR family transcriptional regulator, copper efflux regulator